MQSLHAPDAPQAWPSQVAACPGPSRAHGHAEVVNGRPASKAGGRSERLTCGALTKCPSLVSCVCNDHTVAYWLQR